MNWIKTSLKAYNTFGIDAVSEHFVRIKSLKDLSDLCKTNQEELFILGGGSNILLPDVLSIPVLKNELKGIEIIEEDEQSVLIKVMSGEIWHDLVEWSVEHDYGGIENLALIPGTVGAAPIQNIGAYGVELESVLIRVEAICLKGGAEVVFSKKDCKLAYRDSVFKNDLKGKYFITSLELKLDKKEHTLQLSYGAIQQELDKLKINKPTIRNVFDVVVAIRSAKLPDPKLIGNSGSFFKNVELNRKELLDLKEKMGDVLNFPMDNSMFKVPTGWLLEKCGWKGKTIGNVGCYEKQALIVINKGKADGEEIRKFARLVIKDVMDKTGIVISPEVNFIPQNK